MSTVMKQIEKKLVVSCQALAHEPLFGSHIMMRMAAAAVEGGASAIRANTPQDIKAIKETVSVPVIGLYKQDYEGYDVYITPTMKEVREVAEAGAEIIAVDATNRIHPGKVTTAEFIEQIKKQLPDILIMADISTLEEGIAAEQMGVHMLSTTLSGYTPYSKQMDSFNFELLEELLKVVQIPVIAEGRVQTPQEAAACLQKGAYSVVVGSAITRPQEITKSFAVAVQQAVQE